MKKFALSSIVAVAVTFTAITAFASSGVVMFGDTVQRTHVNTINDGFPWSTEAIIKSAPGVPTMASSSTAMGAGNILYYPVSAGSASNNFQGIGYMTVWNTGSWSGGLPKFMAETAIPDVSNSSPVYDPTTGDAYLAAGAEFYRFHWTGTTLQKTSVSIGGTGNLDGGNNYNQVVSYPLYVTASELGTSSDEIFVTTQNGYLYEINPNTMEVVGYKNFGVRFDASPSLVTATDGTSYIAATGAYDANNNTFGGDSGTGMLFLINPRNGNFQYFPNPAGPIPSVASPIGIKQGEVMWNDVDGDVFLGTVNANGTITFSTTKTTKWFNIGNGQTSDLSESGYSAVADEYIVPFTDKGSYGYATVDPDATNNQIHQYSASGASGQIYPIGSPEISASGNMYLADQIGGIDEISENPTTHQFDGTRGGFLPSFGSSSGTPLSTPSELMLDTANGTEEPTLTLATNQGLELWATTGGEQLTFGSTYSSTLPTQFSSPLTLTPSDSNLPTDPGNTDQIEFNINVNGGSFKDAVGSVATYDKNGNPIVSSITIPTSTLNSWLANYQSSYPNAWNTNGQNNVVIEAYPEKSDVFTYQFTGSSAMPGGHSAEVTVSFPSPGSTPPTPPSNPPIGCTSSGNVSCSSALPGYTEWRFLSPGMLNTNEGENFAYAEGSSFTGTDGDPIAYKLHPIPEQAITSAPAAQYTAYYTYQNNPDGKDTQPANWFNNFTIEFVNGAGMQVGFGVKGEIKTIGDVLYRKHYISSWTPNWTQGSYTYTYACTNSNGNPSTCTGVGTDWTFAGYSPNYSDEYLYRNTSITETTSANLAIGKNVTYWWNPSTITVTASGNFNSSTETPITPAGSGLTWTQPVWASYGSWIPADSTNGTDFSQVPVTSGLNNTNTVGLTPNSMLPGTPADDTPANAPAPDTQSNGVWYSDALMPPTPNPSIVYAKPSTSPVGTPVSHSFDAEHNGGVLFQPNTANSDYPQMGAGEWWVMPTYTITSGSSTFEHSQISTWIPTWAKQWFNNGGEGVVSSESSTVTWNN